MINSIVCLLLLLSFRVLDYRTYLYVGLFMHFSTCTIVFFWGCGIGSQNQNKSIQCADVRDITRHDRSAGFDISMFECVLYMY